MSPPTPLSGPHRHTCAAQVRRQLRAGRRQGDRRHDPLRADETLGQPSDIAAAVAFFASDAAEYITGQTLSVSGGLTMA